MQLLRLLSCVALTLTATSCASHSLKVIDSETEMASQPLVVHQSGKYNTLDFRYTILGMVKKPGQYPMDPDNPTSLADAIARAGNLLPGCDYRRVQIVRKTNEGYKLIAAHAGYEPPTGSLKAKNVELFRNDVIIVDHQFWGF